MQMAGCPLRAQSALAVVSEGVERLMSEYVSWFGSTQMSRGRVNAMGLTGH